MMVLKIGEEEYKVKFGYNSFCDTDLMERTSDLLKLFSGGNVKDDKDVTGMGQIKQLFCCVRELLYVGFEKLNPVENIKQVGDILDDYMDSAPEGEKRGILDLFTKLTEELMNEGFLADLMEEMTKEVEVEEKVVKIPQDHQKKKK